MKFGMDTIFGMANSILAFIFEIDAFFIKYSWSDDKVSKHTRRGRTTMKFGMETIFGMANSILAFIFEIDAFFIKYSWSDDKVSKTYK